MRKDARRVWLATLCVASLAGAAAPAGAEGFSAATMFSEPGDYIGGGVERIFHSGNGSLSISGTAAQVSVGVSGGSRGDSFSMSFAAPAGEVLEDDGVYTRAQRTPFREDGRPGISISGSGRGCNKVEGSFEVTDLATDPATGKVVRFGAVYEQHCEGGSAALFGEVRYGYAAPAGPAAIPTHLRFPTTDLLGASSVQPVTLLAWSAPVTVTSATLTGPDAGAFSVRADECSGRTLAPGQSCQVFVRSDGTDQGTKRAALRFAHAGGLADVRLDAHVRGGRTRFVMNSENGDYIGGGKSRAYTPADATMSASGTRRRVRMSVDGADGASWDATFEAGGGDILAAGRTYENATRYPFNDSGHGMDVSGNGRGCNRITGEFTVHEARYDDHGELQALSLTYEQHCEGATPALRGTVEFRAGDTTTAPPWEEPYGPGQWTPPPDDDAAPGAPKYDDATQPDDGADAPAPPAPLAAPPAPARSAPPVASVHPSVQLGVPNAPRDCGTRALRARHGPAGSRRADRLRATGAAEVFSSGSGNDVVWALGGDDCVTGGPGHDRLYGGAGSDVLRGGSGNDTLDGGPGRDVLLCGAGRDVARVGTGDRTRGCERIVRVGTRGKARSRT